MNNINGDFDVLRFWTDPLMLSCIMIVCAGYIARAFVAPEPIIWRVLMAEVVLSAIGTVGIYIFAELQGMGDLEKLLASVLMSVGGIHTVQRGWQVYLKLKGG